MPICAFNYRDGCCNQRRSCDRAGGKGKDKLKGGSGADTYMASKGTDTIHGFNIQQGDLLSGFGDTGGLDISDSGKFCIVSGNGYTAKLKGVEAGDLIAAMESVFI